MLNITSGKTSFVDDTYVLKPYNAWDMFKDQTDVTFRVLYRSMERRKSDKLAKWACWKMYQDFGILIDHETLLGYRKTKINEDIWKKVVGVRDWADRMLDYVDIRDGRTTPSQFNDWVTGHALRHGKLLISDEIGVYRASESPVYLDRFSAGKVRKLDNGDLEPIVTATVDGVEYELKRDEKVYIPKRENEITIVVSDHLGKFTGEPGLTTKKTIVDKASEYNSDFRDIFGYSPVAISQFNRAIGDIQRIKHADGDLAPILEDFKDSGGSQEDADLILALFNPYRYKSYDDSGMYKGYNIRDNMVNAYGFNRYRLISILKNSYGIDDVDFGLKFLGEVSNFTTLPKPNADGSVSQELLRVYEDIQRGF